MHQNDQSNTHVPVLLERVLAYLDPRLGESYLDLTAGYGGHATEILKRTNNPAQTVLVDRDPNAVENLEAKFRGQDVKILSKDYLTASQELKAEGRKFDVMLADLGMSSPHLNQASRGFALNASGPLDMRMDPRQPLTAGDIINTYPEEEIAGILERYGEEPKARRIARLITEARPIASTTELAHLVATAWPGHSKVHPATRTFQALRIAVNNELDLLEQALPLWIDLLAPGGRIVVISFHSLEDRLVKQAFNEASKSQYDATLSLLTKHPVTAGNTEVVFNPRARSAKLRAAVKINK